MKVSVILPAAGLGTRMAKVASPEKTGTSRKQFMLLNGSPILVYTVRKFVKAPSVTDIIIAVQVDDLEWVREMVEAEHFDKPVRLVLGGSSRQESVQNALASLGADTDLVAVHDAVRPFITVEQIEAVIKAGAETGAAIVAVVPVDTVKRVQKDKVRATLPRENLILTQTPQVFRFALIKEAFAKAADDGFIGTDESSLVERLEQVEVTVVPGGDRNIKITRPGDMTLATLFATEEAAV